MYEWILKIILNNGLTVDMIYKCNESKSIVVVQTKILKDAKTYNNNWLIGTSLDRTKQVFVNIDEISSIEIDV